MEYMDYKGNKIKEGMTLVIICTHSIFKPIDKSINYPKEQWIPCLEYDVIRKDAELWVEFHSGENTSIQHIERLIHGLPENHIISIKGISDNQN
jgi:hypothetical protein